MWNLSLSAWHISFIKTGFRESGTKHRLSPYRWELHDVVNDSNFIVYLTFQIHQYNNVLLRGKHGAQVVKIISVPCMGSPHTDVRLEAHLPPLL